MDEYRRLATIGVSFGIESHILGPAEMQKLFPLINPEVIAGGLYSPGDGVVDPAMLCAALRKGATVGGGKVIVLCVAYLLLGYVIHTHFDEMMN
jgi:sarcosine dehydrogenase